MFYKDASQNINPNGVVSVQGMVIDPTAVRVKERVGKNMVHIYQHCGKQDQPVAFPVRFIIPVRYRPYGNKMKKVMDDVLEHFFRLSVVGSQLSVEISKKGKEEMS